MNPLLAGEDLTFEIELVDVIERLLALVIAEKAEDFVVLGFLFYSGIPNPRMLLTRRKTTRQLS